MTIAPQLDSAHLSELLAPVLATHPDIAVAYLFGSVARGAARPDSDLDIGLVYRDHPQALADHDAVLLASEIARRTGVAAVDVIDLAAQGPVFCHEVLCTGVCIYETDHARRVDFESDVLVRAFDFRPTYDLATRGKIAGLRRWLRERNDLR